MLSGNSVLAALCLFLLSFFFLLGGHHRRDTLKGLKIPVRLCLRLKFMICTEFEIKACSVIFLGTRIFHIQAANRTVVQQVVRSSWNHIQDQSSLDRAGHTRDCRPRSSPPYILTECLQL